ncbi:heme utilization cystosolic carrier protein HutX [Snodgrassella alvi]|uniref:heme utilization cystosolic carrier protein HutX n=1 Tax=Snodgrassella alvi TaxID=1196083 RepID=UPI0035113927
MTKHPENNNLQLFMRSNPEGTLEQIAQQYQVTLAEVIKAIPDVVITAGSHFDAVWQDVQSWGEITFLVHTADIIAEFSGLLPAGKYGAGYFNLQHQQGFGGHIRAENCAQIAFVERSFMQMATASIIFLNQHGDAMFKIFVGRDEQRQLKAEQLNKFRSLAQRFATTQEQ